MALGRTGWFSENLFSCISLPKELFDVFKFLEKFGILIECFDAMSLKKVFKG